MLDGANLLMPFNMRRIFSSENNENNSTLKLKTIITGEASESFIIIPGHRRNALLFIRIHTRNRPHIFQLCVFSAIIDIWYLCKIT